MSFLESPRFPGCPKFGYTAEPMYSTTIIQRAGGQERRNQNWAYPLTRITVTVGPTDAGEADIQELLRFWHAVRGQAYGFRVKDFADFKSCEVQDTPAATDSPLVLIDGSPESYQLTKRYTYGSPSQDRAIYKPVAGTLIVADGGVVKTETTDYTVDYTTGIVTLNFTPATSPDDLSWGGEFDLPMRFEGNFPIEIVSRRVQSVSFMLQEIRL